MGCQPTRRLPRLEVVFDDGCFFFFFMLRVGTDVSFPAVPLLSKALEKVRQDAVCGPGSCVAWN